MSAKAKKGCCYCTNRSKIQLGDSLSPLFVCMPWHPPGCSADCYVCFQYLMVGGSGDRNQIYMLIEVGEETHYALDNE